MNKNQEALHAFYRSCLTVNTTTDLVATLSRILADDLVSHGSVDKKNKQELIAQIGYFWKLVPDLVWEPQAIVNEGDIFVVRSIASGTPNGNFMGLPTNGTKKFSIMTIDIHRMKDGQSLEVHHLEDWGTAMKQLQP